MITWGFTFLSGLSSAADAESVESNHYFVNQAVVGGAADGSSWSDAFAHLEDALAVAAPGDEIWVAAGEYYPGEGTRLTDISPSISFVMTDGTKIYGDFAGTESTLEERDWQKNVSVLSGDVE